MKVAYPNFKAFGDVYIGETFVYEDGVFLKIETAVIEKYNCQVNAVDLESGKTYEFDDEDEVRVVESKVTIY